MNKNCFAMKLHAKLPGSELGGFSDSSGIWINIKLNNNKTLEIGFDSKGEKIVDISLFQDIIGVIDTKTVFRKKL